mmetsp:Transcript_105361/g.187322  ORF Transcript_105361/g.187322 Transcript_105361/m.187322 type:complete len:349 (-) Transcript_105361:82-1128(-)
MDAASEAASLSQGSPTNEERSDGRQESDSGSDNEQEESIEVLLSGPKDSVTMFKDVGRPKIQLEMLHGADPLDLLAKQVQARVTPTKQGTLMVDTPETISPQSSSGSTDPGRHKLHQELDNFLDVASRKEASCIQKPDRMQEELEAKDRVIQRLLEQMQEAEQYQEEQKETISRLTKTAEMHWQRTLMLERERQQAVSAQQELEADLATANLQVFDLQRRLSEDQEAFSTMQAMQEKVEAQQRAQEVTEQEIGLLKGERQALRQTSPQELLKLASTLGESMQRVQAEQLRQFEALKDMQLCVVCLSEPKNVVLQPCSHLTMCTKCFSQCSRTCPQCRAPVEGHLVIFA